jgi:hypothetical protein
MVLCTYVRVGRDFSLTLLVGSFRGDRKKKPEAEKKGKKRCQRNTFVSYFAFLRKVDDRLSRAFRYFLYEACDAAHFDRILEFTEDAKCIREAVVIS